LGPAGSGKGTQADMLAEKLGLPVISPGELLRNELDHGSSLGREIRETMVRGELVQDKIVEDMISKRLGEKDASKGFVMDGYPRREEQLVCIAPRMEDVAKENVIAFFIDSSDEEIKARVVGRLVCDCGAAYHVENNPPKVEGICDLCGAKIYQREDDKPEVLASRLKQFRRLTGPVLDYFSNFYKLIRIDGDKRIDDVKKEIWGYFKL
jgi:adenylate kinase